MKEHIVHAVRRMSLLKYFPGDEVARVEIMRLLDRLASKPEQLDWLVDTLIDEVGEWPGPKELRGIFCTRYPPKDGIESDAEHGKFSAVAMESRAALAEPPKQDRRLLPAGTAEPVSADPECQALVKRLDKATDLGGIRVRKSDTLAARRWMESVGLGHMTGLPPLREGE